MKKIVLLLSSVFLFCLPGFLFSAEISERQDLAIFGLTYYSYDIPDSVLGYVDSSISHVFINLKRFNVLGYGNYRIESRDIDDFIKRIRETQAAKAKEAGTYDEKFGTVVISGEDFDRIVGSFIVVLPSLSNYSVGIEQTEVKSGFITRVVDSYMVDIVVDMTFVNVREGTQEESVRITGRGGGVNLDRANKQAVDSAISMLSYRIRQIDAFKIKSGVIRTRGDTLYFELGKNIGVKPGDEYEVMTKQEIGKTGRIVELPTGFVRVKKVYPDVTEAKVVFQKEKITEGDQLVEVAALGVQASIHAGVMKVDIPDMNYDILLVSDELLPAFTDTYYISLDQRKKDHAIVVGFRVSKNLGYRYKGIFDGTALLNFPLFAGIGELGASASFNKRRLSFELGAQAGFVYMTTFQMNLYRNGLDNDFSIEGTNFSFDNDPVLSIYGISGGLKGSAGLKFLINPKAAIRAGVNYRLYIPINDWKIKIKETSGSKESVTIDSNSRHIHETPDSEGMKQVKLSGYELNLSFILRF